ncbi:alcohol dehydrogenase catalytic domain-containing protein [Streptomyces sp. NBC_01231]|nr:alcohol dehydrogenase catalytic domain-containing protein [Streptomyces sp. NBC_01231]
MRAAATSSFGPAETLRLTEVAKGGTPLAGSVTFPLIPGNEFAGVVDGVGEGVTEFSAGDEVLGFGLFGCYAEYVPADQLVSKAPNMPWEIAGGNWDCGTGAPRARLPGSRSW